MIVPSPSSGSWARPPVTSVTLHPSTLSVSGLARDRVVPHTTDRQEVRISRPWEQFGLANPTV